MLDTTSTAPHLPDRCPAGCPNSGRLNLLTSMIRYYVCDKCNRRWNVARLDVTEPLSTPVFDVAG